MDSVVTFLSDRKVCVALSSTAFCVAMYGLRRHFAGGVCRSKTRLDGRVVIVTGANCGIGKETALECARRGGKVILGCRDLLRGERAVEDIKRCVVAAGAPEPQVRVEQIDLANLTSVREFAKRVKQKESRVDILVNNAGVMACPEWRSTDNYEMQFAVNHLGHFLLTNLLLDEITAAGKVSSTPARVVNVSSLAHERGVIHFENINLEDEYHPWTAYSQSKLANVLFTSQLAKVLIDRNINAVTYSVHPGVIITELGRHIMKDLPWYKYLMYFLLGPLVLKTPKQGAQTSLHCIFEDNLPSGKYFSDCREKTPAPNAQNMDDAQRLWSLSAKMVGL